MDLIFMCVIIYKYIYDIIWHVTYDIWHMTYDMHRTWMEMSWILMRPSSGQSLRNLKVSMVAGCVLYSTPLITRVSWHCEETFLRIVHMCSEYQPYFQDVQEASAPTKSPLEIDPKVHGRPCSLLPAPANGRNHQGDQSLAWKNTWNREQTSEVTESYSHATRISPLVWRTVKWCIVGHGPVLDSSQ